MNAEALFFDRTINIEDVDSLLEDRSLSPFEHCARVDEAEHSIKQLLPELKVAIAEMRKLSASLDNADRRLRDAAKKERDLESAILYARHRKVALLGDIAKLKERLTNIQEEIDKELAIVRRGRAGLQEYDESLLEKAMLIKSKQHKRIQSLEELYHLDREIFRLWKPWMDDANVRCKIALSIANHGEDYSI